MTNQMNYRVVPVKDPMILYSGDYGTRAATESIAAYYRKLGYCELEEFWDVWGWTEGLTEEGCQDWRISLYK